MVYADNAPVKLCDIETICAGIDSPKRSIVSSHRKRGQKASPFELSLLLREKLLHYRLNGRSFLAAQVTYAASRSLQANLRGTVSGWQGCVQFNHMPIGIGNMSSARSPDRAVLGRSNGDNPLRNQLMVRLVNIVNTHVDNYLAALR